MDATRIRTAITKTVTVIVLALGGPVGVTAQDIMENPTVDGIVEALSPAASRLLEREPGSRSLRGVTVEPAEIEEPVSINLRVQFDYDMATLTSEAILTLDTLGGALSNEELAGLSFVITGHTDAKGPDGYNQSLSERRAIAVVSFLQERHGLESSRLSSRGLGESQLLIPVDPENPENRRVQIEALPSE